MSSTCYLSCRRDGDRGWVRLTYPNLTLVFILIFFSIIGGIPNVPQTLTGPIVGQLTPWPGVTQPAPIVCTPEVPVSSAGADFTVKEGASVNLVGGSNLAGGSPSLIC